jgi:hypothetical protein
MKFIKFYLLKDKLNYKKIIMSTKSNFIIVTSSAKQCEAKY